MIEATFLISDNPDNMLTGAFLTLQDQKPMLMIAPTSVMQKFHSGLTYSGVNNENKGMD